MSSRASSLLPASAPTRLFVGGEWLTSVTEFEVIDPATLRPLTTTGDAGPEEAAQAVAAAADALRTWSTTAPRVRSDVLRRTHELLLAELEEGARIITLENGKATRDARAEIATAAEFFRWFSEAAVRIEGSILTAPSGDKAIITEHRPVGVSYLITPWNFPASMVARKLAPALAAGCTAVLKPAPETPLTALWIGSILERAGLPAGVVNILTTSRAAAVTGAVLADRRVRALSFTGSTGVGKLLLAQAASRVLRCSMELGGNGPFLVLDDANVDDAVAGAVLAKTRNGGAACNAANRFYVHASLAERFAQGLRAALGALRVGPGIDPSNDIGAMVSERERNKLTALLEGAREAGARVDVLGSVPDVGAFVAPAVVTGVKHGSALVRDEIFGPIAPVMTFGDDEEAIELANDTDHGLMGYVYGGDRGRAIRVGRQLESGLVAINRGLISDPAAPFGGMKQSGLGREGGTHGIHEFLEVQYLGVTW